MVTEVGGEGAITVIPPQWQVAVIVVLSYSGRRSPFEEAMCSCRGEDESVATLVL